jgi:acetylglutamate kinase
MDRSGLDAEKLVMLTDVAGLRRDPNDPSSTVSRLRAGELTELVNSGAVVGGMVPKVEAVLHAVNGGCAAAHLLDGRIPHAVLLELFTDGGVGTMVLP